MKPKFLNIDLELITKKEPKNLLQDLGDSVSIMYSGDHEGDYLLTLEVTEWFDTEIPILKEFERILSSLSNDGKTEFSEAVKREFNFGYETETTPHRVEFSLSEEIQSLISKMNGSIGITIYHNQE